MKSKIAVRAAARLGQELVSSNSRLMVAKNDPAAAVRESVATLRALEECAARLPLDELREAQSRRDAMAVQRIVRIALFG
ncbi:hypothetical protein [Streptomyces cyaneus]|uniref:hypothetical protein n=1 Tax=Streptomyces cyaneus TaxID=1904 RepID=UPI003CCC886F